MIGDRKAPGRSLKILAVLSVITGVVLPGSLLKAAEWMEVTRNAPGTVIYYLDAESVHQEGDKVTFWDKRVVSDDPDFKELRGYIEMDCREIRYRTLRIRGFDRKGSSFTDQEPGQWQHIDANAAMAVFQSRLCQ
jgi:hypothetical protein